jgi:hypothetical protein
LICLIFSTFFIYKKNASLVFHKLSHAKEVATRKLASQPPERLNVVANIVDENAHPSKVALAMNFIHSASFSTQGVSLATIAKIIYNFGFFQHVIIKKISQTDLAISIKTRKPLLCISLDKVRYVDSHGQVYGFIDNESLCPLHLVHGIKLDPPYAAKFNQERTIVLSKKNQSHIADALELQRVVLTMQISMGKSITFHQSRGFSFNLGDSSIEVTAGYPPYENKLKRLLTVLKNNQQSHLEKIELDFPDKAFVKYSKITN